MGVSVKELENFIVTAQPDLETIKRELNAFNIFNVLGVQYREIRHSNFLGWLFDPNESHHLGDVFLKGLFKVMRDCDVLDAHEYVQLLLKDVSGTKVYRESVHNIDILIANKQHGFVIVIENKIYAGYSEGQLKKYHEFVENNYRQFGKRIYLTLTPKRNDSHKSFERGKNYTNINYQNIISLLVDNRELIEDTLPTVKESINQYIDMVQKDITRTSKEVLLAKEIYKSYKKEIDFIVSNQDNFANYKDDILEFILTERANDFIISHDSGNKNVIYLLPKNENLRKLFHYPEAKSRDGEYIFSLVLYLEKDAVWIKFGFGDIKECDNRIEIQAKKESQFDHMKLFDCIINSKLGIDRHDHSSSISFPSICGVQLFNDNLYYESNKSILDLFADRLDDINEELIQPWIEECIKKLS